jgi:hypothetical protein
VFERGDSEATSVVFGEELVNTSDATVKRIQFEKDAHDRACARARDQVAQLLASYDASFAARVGMILQNVDVKLPTLPQQFAENMTLS